MREIPGTSIFGTRFFDAGAGPGVSCVDNEELLDQFINNQEPMYFSKQRSGPRRQVSRVDEANFEPEDAFMKISSNLRQALKKHPPMGMLEVSHNRTQQK